MTPTFSLLHTTARVPDGWQEACIQWFRHCDRPADVEYVIFKDTNTTLGEVPTEWYGFGSRSFAGTATKGHCSVGSANGWNHAAEASHGKFLITISDDYRPCEHWDTEILKAIPTAPKPYRSLHEALQKGPCQIPDMDGEYVLDVDNQDGAPHIPFSFLTRAYYNRYGYIFYPEYKGLMADLDFTNIARRDGVVVNAKHLKFRHLHYLCGTAPNDEVYQKQQETLTYGQAVYAKRAREWEVPATAGVSA
jgi:hypothetical protein